MEYVIQINKKNWLKTNLFKMNKLILYIIQKKVNKLRLKNNITMLINETKHFIL